MSSPDRSTGRAGSELQAAKAVPRGLGGGLGGSQLADGIERRPCGSAVACQRLSELTRWRGRRRVAVRYSKRIAMIAIPALSACLDTRGEHATHADRCLACATRRAPIGVPQAAALRNVACFLVTQRHGRCADVAVNGRLVRLTRASERQHDVRQQGHVESSSSGSRST